MNKENLAKAQARKRQGNPDDEYYTRYGDIDRELWNYKEQFKGKRVYCPADDYRSSEFVRWFTTNFKELGLKSFTATHYINQQGDLFNQRPPSKPIKFEYDGSVERTTPLQGDGDMLGEECRAIIKNSDIIATNPPFSLSIDLQTLLLHVDVDFILVSSLPSLSNRPFVKHLYTKRAQVGHHTIAKFVTAEGGTKAVGAIWLQSLKDIEHPPLVLTESYDPVKHPKYDNYDAIECSKVADIPKDYYGKVGVPISYLLKHDQRQFDFLGVFKSWTGWKGGGRIIGSPVVTVRGTLCRAPVLNSRELFSRSFIRRRAET